MATKTVTLTDFLLARIAEDEADVRATTLPDSQYGTPWHWRSRARVLAECEAKRRLVEWTEVRAICDLHPETAANGCTMCEFVDNASSYDRVTLGFLAAVYADHPDYRDEWSI